MLAATRLRAVLTLIVPIVVTGAGGVSCSTEKVTTAKNSPDRIICREAGNTGSMISKRQCKTAREWEEQAESDQALIRGAEPDTAPVPERSAGSTP